MGGRTPRPVTPDNAKLYVVVRRAWRQPFSLACDFARHHVAHVAMAACMGLITTRIEPGVYGRTWIVTAAGIRVLNEMETQ